MCSRWVVAGLLAVLISTGMSTSSLGGELASPAFAPAGTSVSTPIGHYEFCRSWPGECQARGDLVETIVLTTDLWRQILQVNANLNATVAPVTDRDLYNVDERWTYPTNAGDCEDYALGKQRALIAAGFAQSTLLLTVVRQPNGEGHAVLLVRTDRGDLVLDNQDGDVHVWNETPYTYLKRQSQTDPSKWVGINDDRTTVVASIHN